MKSMVLFLILSVALQLTNCKHLPNKEQFQIIIEVENPISFIIKNETITLSAAFITKVYHGINLDL